MHLPRYVNINPNPMVSARLSSALSVIKLAQLSPKTSSHLRRTILNQQHVFQRTDIGAGRSRRARGRGPRRDGLAVIRDGRPPGTAGPMSGNTGTATGAAATGAADTETSDSGVATVWAAAAVAVPVLVAAPPATDALRAAVGESPLAAPAVTVSSPPPPAIA